jgi:type II secretory pathway component GspD/PulD (secretin)
MGDERGAFTYVAGLDNGFSSTVAALIEEHRVRVIQKPRIQTSSGVPTSLFIGETVPYVHGTGYVNSGSPHSCRSQSKMGMQLEITPVIESDGAISIDIKSTVERTKLTGVSDLPDTTTTQSTVSVMVRNGDMLLVGGATQTPKQRFPPIPGRGTLNDRSNRPRRTELVILLRFVVLSPDSDRLRAK